MIEDYIRDILNAGLGALRTGEEETRRILQDIQDSYERLRDKGEHDSSEPALLMRDLVERTIRGIRDLAEGQDLSHITAELQRQSQQALDQIRSLLGEQRISDFNDRLDELRESILRRSSSSNEENH